MGIARNSKLAKGQAEAQRGAESLQDRPRQSVSWREHGSTASRQGLVHWSAITPPEIKQSSKRLKRTRAHQSLRRDCRSLVTMGDLLLVGSLDRGLFRELTSAQSVSPENHTGFISTLTCCGLLGEMTSMARKVESSSSMLLPMTQGSGPGSLLAIKGLLCLGPGLGGSRLTASSGSFGAGGATGSRSTDGSGSSTARFCNLLARERHLSSATRRALALERPGP